MTAKTASKSAKSAAAKSAKTVDAVPSHSELAVAMFSERRERFTAEYKVLLAVDTSAMNGDELKAHKSALCHAANSVKYAERFLEALATESAQNIWDTFALEPTRVNALAWYAQEKVLFILRAIAANAPLSSITDNDTTRSLFRALKKAALQTREMPARMHDENKTLGMSTYSSQATTSRNALDMFGMLDYDALSKRYSLNDTAEKYAHIINA